MSDLNRNDSHRWSDDALDIRDQNMNLSQQYKKTLRSNVEHIFINYKLYHLYKTRQKRLK